MANTYRFKTIMVHDYDRHKFTCMRDRCAKAAGVRVTDKDLYAAIADSMNPAMVEELVVARAKEVVALRAQAKLEKLPYVLVIGDDDVAHATVGVNPRGGEVERNVAFESFVERLAADVAGHS